MAATDPPEEQCVDVRKLPPAEYRAARQAAVRATSSDLAHSDARALAAVQKRHAANPPIPRSASK